jgi:hypothetical protein
VGVFIPFYTTKWERISECRNKRKRTKKTLNVKDKREGTKEKGQSMENKREEQKRKGQRDTELRGQKG